MALEVACLENFKEYERGYVIEIWRVVIDIVNSCTVLLIKTVAVMELYSSKDHEMIHNEMIWYLSWTST